MSSYPPTPPQYPPPYDPSNPWQTQRPGMAPPRRSSTMLLPLAVAGIVIAVVAGSILAYRMSRPKPRAQETMAQKYGEMSRAFSTTNPSDVAEAAAIKSALNAFAAANARKDFIGAADCFDTDRMIREVQSLGMMTNLSRRDHASAANGMRVGLRNAMSQPLNGLAVTRVEIRSIRSLASDEALVYLRAYHGEIGRIKYRWWVCKRSGRWRIYDLEELDGGIRLSNMMGAALSAGTGNAPKPWIGHVPKLQALIQAALGEDIAGAKKALKQLEGVQFPPQIQAMVVFLKAMLTIGEGEFREGLKLCDEAEGLNSDLPVLLFARAIAHNGLGEHDKALEHCKRYLDLLGDDAVTLSQMGVALEGLDRKDEAVDAFRRGFDDDPSESDNFLGLARLLPNSKAGELAERLGKSPDSKALFAEAAPEIGEAEKLSALVAAYRKLHGADIEYSYHEARVRILREKPAEAMPILKQAMGKASGEDKERLEELFIDAALGAMKYEEAYATFSDKEAGFGRVCRELQGEGLAGELTKFIADHEKDVPSSPWPLYYRGYLLEQSKDYAGAAAQYELAFKRQKKDGENFAVIYAYARASYKAGKALDVLSRAAAQQRESLFDELTSLAYEEKDAATLGRLIESQRKTGPELQSVRLNEMRLMRLNGDFAGIAAIPRKQIEALRADGGYADEAHELLIRALIRLNRIDDARRELGALKPEDRLTTTDILVHAAAKDLAATEKSITAYLDEDGELEDLYGDADIARLLGAPELAALKKKFPDPTTRPAEKR